MSFGNKPRSSTERNVSTTVTTTTKGVKAEGGALALASEGGDITILDGGAIAGALGLAKQSLQTVASTYQNALGGSGAFQESAPAPGGDTIKNIMPLLLGGGLLLGGAMFLKRKQ